MGGVTDAEAATQVAYDMPGLCLLLAARRRSLGLRQLEVDEIAGLASGYTGKLECGDKRLGNVSLPAILGTLRCGLMLAHSPHTEMPENIRVYEERSKIISRQNGRRGGILAAARLTPQQRRERARNAARKRWLDWRAIRARKVGKRKKGRPK